MREKFVLQLWVIKFWKNLLLLSKVFQAASFLYSQQIQETSATRTWKQSTCEWTFKPVINQQLTTAATDKLTTWVKEEKSKPSTEALHSVLRNVLQLQFLSKHSSLTVSADYLSAYRRVSIINNQEIRCWLGLCKWHWVSSLFDWSSLHWMKLLTIVPSVLFYHSSSKCCFLSSLKINPTKKHIIYNENHLYGKPQYQILLIKNTWLQPGYLDLWFLPLRIFVLNLFYFMLTLCMPQKLKSSRQFIFI